MSVKLRFKRLGRKKRPFYRLVAIDSRSRRDGREIEKLGWFNPSSVDETFKFNENRVVHWLDKGAIPSLTVKNLLGKVRQISSKFGLPKMNQPGFRFDKEQGASCLYDVGIYPISLILSLFPDEEIVIEESHLIFDQSTGIDVAGSASLLIDSRIHCSLDWSYNTSYRNEVDVWGEKSSLFTKKIFSKDKDYIPTFIISNRNGEISEIEIEKSNHFLSMLNFFSKTITDENFAKEQRSQINKLAECLSRINEIG